MYLGTWVPEVIAGETLTRERVCRVSGLRATKSQRSFDERSLERRASWSTVNYCEAQRTTVKHECVKIIARAT